MKSKSPDMTKSGTRTEKSLQEERISRKRAIRRMYEQYILLERENRNLMSEITNNENFLNFVLENTKNEANIFLANLEEMVNGDVKPRFGLEDPFIKKHIDKIVKKFEKEGYEVKYTGRPIVHYNWLFPAFPFEGVFFSACAVWRRLVAVHFLKGLEFE